MSYTALPVTATGDVWTASNHNLYIRDNFRAVPPDIVAAKGDLIVGGGADALEILNIGSDGRFLSSNIDWWGYSNLFLFISDTETDGYQLETAGSGNFHVPTYFSDVPEGANFIYCRIEGALAASTASFILYPSYDTTVEAMRIDAHGSTTYSISHGIMPLDSTGGVYYNMTDTDFSMYVYAWMY